MSNKIFLDSSILVEWAKKTQVELFDFLTVGNEYNLCISQIVLSEFAYYWLVVEGKKAPVTLKRDGMIPSIIANHNPVELLTKLTLLEAGPTIIPLYLQYMEQYNLLPNDALILATCKLNGITQIASYDVDFVTACAGEGIQLIQKVADLAV